MFEFQECLLFCYSLFDVIKVADPCVNNRTADVLGNKLMSESLFDRIPVGIEHPE